MRKCILEAIFDMTMNYHILFIRYNSSKERSSKRQLLEQIDHFDIFHSEGIKSKIYTYVKIILNLFVRET